MLMLMQIQMLKLYFIYSIKYIQCQNHKEIALQKIRGQIERREVVGYYRNQTNRYLPKDIPPKDILPKDIPPNKRHISI